MRLERLNYNKIKIFLTYDDLMERGLTKEDLWHDSLKVHQLFREMIEEASEELGFEADGPIAVEVYSLKAQGMVIIVTKDADLQETEEEFLDDYIEMQVTVDESEDILYVFHDIEDIIQLSISLVRLSILGGTLYAHEDHFYLLFDDDSLRNNENLIAVLAEFGNPATMTKYRVHEYGKVLIEENAIEKIYHHFIKRKKDSSI